MTTNSPLLRTALLASALLIASTASARAQEPKQSWDGARPGISRAELEELRTRFENAAESPGYSNGLRARARLQADAIKARLTEGDFQVGDRVVISVEGQETLTNTFDVGTGRMLVLPGVGNVPLQGVLRSELEPRIAQNVARVIRDPAVHARPLIRLAVTGEVGKPGYYTVPLDGLVTDALMLAGGPTARANLGQLRVERGNALLFSGDSLQQAIIDGKTLNQLNVRAGDRITVPSVQQRSVGEIVRLAVVALPTLLFVISQVAGNSKP
jgi:protein involved in polysaccharide export with SLBB domain